MTELDELRNWCSGALTAISETDDGELVAICPWCNRDRLYVNLQRGLFICFRCRQAGGAAYLVAETDGIPIQEAAKKLQSRKPPREDTLLRAILSADRRSPSEEVVDHPLPDEFIPCYTSEGWAVPRYLDKRGITDEMIIRHGLGYAKRGRFWNRVIVPIVQGRSRTFLGRLMGAPEEFSWEDDTGKIRYPSKYLTPRNAGLSRVLYGSTWAKPDADLVVVEGSFDAMRMIDLGYDCVGVLGKRLSPHQAALISSLQPRSVTFLYDAGAYLEAVEDASTLSRRIDVDSCPLYVAHLPEGLDPDTLGLKYGRDGVKDTLEERELIEDDLAWLDAELRAL